MTCRADQDHFPARFSTGRQVHRVQEETFYVVEGECEWQIGEETVRALPGTFVFIPPGVPHNIANFTDKPARVLMTVSPPGHEHDFEELAKLASVATPPDPKAIGDLRRRYDTIQLSALQTSTGSQDPAPSRRVFGGCPQAGGAATPRPSGSCSDGCEGPQPP